MGSVKHPEGSHRILAEESRAAADFLESHRDQILSELSRLKEIPRIVNQSLAAAEWLQAQIALLRGKPEPSYEWMAAFVNGIRGKGGRIGEILTALRSTRDLLLRFCAGRIDGVSDTDLRDIAAESENLYLTFVGDIYGEIERRAFSAEQRLQRTIADLMDRAFVTLDGEGVVRSLNTMFCDLTGLTEDRLIGCEFAALCDDDTAGEVRRALRQRRATAARTFDGALIVRNTVCQTATNCGERISLRFWVSPMFDESGLRSGLAVAMAETENAGIYADETLRSKMLEDLTETLGVGCYTIDEDFRIVSCNSVAHSLVTIGSEDDGAACCRRNLDAQGRCGDCFRRAAFETGSVYRATVQHKTPSGELRWVDLTSVPLRGRRGKVTWVTKFFRDITEQRLLEDQYLRQQRTSFASQLAIAVAHQLRNPLGVMIGFAEMLSRGMPPDQLPSVIDRILRNGIRCKEIVQDLLEFGRVAPGERVPVDVNAILRERVLPLYPAASRITWRLADEASPGAKRGAVVECAPDQLAQVFINLIDNALTFCQTATKCDDANSSVIVETFTRDDMVYVKVRDDGPGVPEEIRARIFEPFFTTRKEAGGVGLGLCLSRSVVQEHGGSLYLTVCQATTNCEETASPGGIERDTARMSVHNTGAGACFVVQLPCAQHEERAPTYERKPEPPPRAGRRVIIVEDETDLLFLLAMALQAEGHEVDCASTGAQAMELLQTGAYDAAVIDMLLGDEFGGQDLYQILLATKPGLAAKSLFITGDTMSYETRRFLSEAKRPFLEKPFMISDFTARLEEILGTSTR